MSLAGSGAAVLLGDARPEQLEEHKRAILALVHSLRAEVPAQVERQDSEPLSRYLFADSPSTVTILGERGSGKTTLLFALCGELMREGRDLVLPPMYPELFSPNESVISAFLASLWGELVGSGNAPSEREDGTKVDADLVRLLGDCARSYAASRTTREALAHAAESTIDFAEDAVEISRSGARLPWQIGELASRICLGPDGQPRLMIVPIDDPDLAPTTVKSILRDLRVLGSIPGVVPVASFSPTDLAEGWLHDRGPESPAERVRAAHLFERETEKLFPYRARFEIQSFAVADRIAFAPIGESKPLRSQLADLRAAVGKLGVRWPIDEILTQASVRHGVPNALPENPRTLVQLWSALDQIDPEAEEVSKEVLDQTLRSLCVLLSEPLRMNMGLTAGERFYDLGQSAEHDDEGRILIQVEPRRVQLYGISSSRLTISHNPEGMGSIAIRKMVRVEAGRPSADSPDDRLERLRPRATAALLAFHEVVYGSDRFVVESPPCRIEWKDWRNAQEVILAGLATDRRFLFLPEATTLSEVFQTVDAWNELEAMAAGGASSQDLLLRALRASCAGLDQAEEEFPDEYMAAFEVATRLYLGAIERADRASARFCRWYELDLPMQWHSAFFDGEVLRKCVAEYREATAHALDRDTSSGLLNPRVVIDTRFAEILETIASDEDRARHCWIAGYFQLAASVESTRLEELVALGPYWRERTASHQAGSRAADQFLTRSASAHRLAPYPTPEGHELFARARDLLRRRSAATSRRAIQQRGQR